MRSYPLNCDINCPKFAAAPVICASCAADRFAIFCDFKLCNAVMERKCCAFLPLLLRSSGKAAANALSKSFIRSSFFYVRNSKKQPFFFSYIRIIFFLQTSSSPLKLRLIRSTSSCVSIGRLMSQNACILSHFCLNPSGFILKRSTTSFSHSLALRI